MPPIAGPMTRDAFMLTELSDTAPARSLRGTRVGVSDRKAGDWRAAPVPMKATAKRNRARDGSGFRAIQARNSEPTSCSTLSHRMSLRRSKVSASPPPTTASSSWGPRLAKPTRLTNQALLVML